MVYRNAHNPNEIFLPVFSEIPDAIALVSQCFVCSIRAACIIVCCICNRRAALAGHKAVFIYHMEQKKIQKITLFFAVLKMHFKEQEGFFYCTIFKHPTRFHPQSTRSHSQSPGSHPHSARFHPHSARSHSHSARYHPNSAKSHTHSGKYIPLSAVIQTRLDLIRIRLDVTQTRLISSTLG